MCENRFINSVASSSSFADKRDHLVIEIPQLFARDDFSSVDPPTWLFSLFPRSRWRHDKVTLTADCVEDFLLPPFVIHHSFDSRNLIWRNIHSFDSFLLPPDFTLISRECLFFCSADYLFFVECFIFKQASHVIREQLIDAMNRWR